MDPFIDCGRAHIRMGEGGRSPNKNAKGEASESLSALNSEIFYFRDLMDQSDMCIALKQGVVIATSGEIHVYSNGDAAL